MDPNFHYHPRCNAQKIVQLSFVDDLLLFCRGDIKSVKCMNQCFMQFSQASGLVANIKKSSVYFGGVKQELQREILEELHFVKEHCHSDTLAYL